MPSRRHFIASALGAGLALATQGCRQMAPQAARKRMIVDSQVHLWKADAPDLRWVPGAKPQMPEPFTIEKALALMDEAGVDRVVIVTPALLGDRNDYSLEAARRYSDRFGVMGRIDQRNPAAGAVPPEWEEQRGKLGRRVAVPRRPAAR